eukprot:TRINITY_DN5289_c0_g1_i2.p2 TRINITY_DN5289_c0_g1~~TRINITY_DN5289_c0_g1_i2.p2  ORF type:complete len:181 (+),score=50.54 TRINITY_DN5289_c0_g1_i2:141-683(+)
MLARAILKGGLRFFASESARYTKPILLLMGAPGVGKGTYGKRLSRDWKMPVFSTGEYLRNLLKKETDLSNRVRGIVQSGKLVDDDTMFKIMEHRLLHDEDQNAKGIILDGFPRNVDQAKMMEKLGTIKAAMNFFLRDDILVEKLAGRRECEKCHIPYLSLIHICRCRRIERCRSRWSPYH